MLLDYDNFLQIRNLMYCETRLSFGKPSFFIRRSLPLAMQR